MTEKELIKYIDLIVKNIEDFDFFSINNILFEHIKPETKQEKDDFLELIESIKLFGKNNELFIVRNKGGWFKLTERGKRLKLSKNSFKSFEKSINKKEWYNENWIGYVIAIIVFLFTIYQYVDNRSLKNEISTLKTQYEIYKDSTYQLNKKLVKFQTERVTEGNEEIVVSDKKPDCELKTLVTINSLLKNGNELNDQNFEKFFTNMSTECANNVEYSQFNNELIFKTLESNPQKFIIFLNRVSKKKEILEFVLTQLRNPIQDGIELNEIYRQLNKTETVDYKTKELVLKSLKESIEKNN
ncbi:hypothetical protein [Lutibacter citreus]|uniref:hypothetical protein n=1 Tax=Lutibacter citreus TaxID=2138210 RepID=UPI000DBE7DB3|nr:hypothetical protein [Lutibacter citreus]